MNRAASPPLALGFVLILLAGCNDAPTGLAPVEPAAASADHNTGGGDTWHPDEHRSRDVARQVPSFGGFSFDSAGNLIIYVKDPRDATAVGRAKALLAPYYASQRGGWKQDAAQPQIFLRQAQFTFSELLQYRSRIDLDVLTTPGVLFIDLDERVNRLVIGVDRARAAGARNAIDAVLSRHGIPRESVDYEDGVPEVAPQNICDPNQPSCSNSDPCMEDPSMCDDGTGDNTENTDPCRLDAASCEPDPCSFETSCAGYSTNLADNSDLRGRVRPVMGGTGITNLPTNALPQMSTLGFGVWYCPPQSWGSCAYYYVVTGHQTFKMAQVTLSPRVKLYQPTSDAANDAYIGIEAFDPMWSKWPFWISLDPPDNNLGTKCQKWENSNSVVCRRSDAALIRAQGPSIGFGYLVRPANPPYTDAYDHGAQQFAVNPANPRMQIVWEAVAENGQVVYKIGATTGWRRGIVTRKCVDKLRNGNGWDEPRYMVFRCQTEVQWSRSGSGDSGGPVFKYTSDGRAELLGLHAAAGPDHKGYYAPMANLRNDFGLQNNNFIDFKVHGPAPR